MNRIMTMALILILVYTIPCNAASGRDGNYLLHACADKAESATTAETKISIFGGNMWCIGFLEGVADMNTLYSQGMLAGKEGAFCVPEEGVPDDQLRRIVIKFLEDNPKILNQSPRILR